MFEESSPEYLGRMTSHLSGHRLDDFVKLNKLGEGTYGVVFKVSKHCVCLLVFKHFEAEHQGQNKKTGEIVAMKKIKLESEDEGVSQMENIGLDLID